MKNRETQETVIKNTKWKIMKNLLLAGMKKE